MLDGAAHTRQSFAWGTIFATPASVSGLPTVLAIPHACRVDPDAWAVVKLGNKKAAKTSPGGSTPVTKGCPAKGPGLDLTALMSPSTATVRIL